MALVYCLLYLLELGALSDLPERISTNLNEVIKVVNKYGSFLTIRNDCAYFIY
jgi:hypothetical protein